jgi:hypothetical protein
MGGCSTGATRRSGVTGGSRYGTVAASPRIRAARLTRSAGSVRCRPIRYRSGPAAAAGGPLHTRPWAVEQAAMCAVNCTRGLELSNRPRYARSTAHAAATCRSGRDMRGQTAHAAATCRSGRDVRGQNAHAAATCRSGRDVRGQLHTPPRCVDPAAELAFRDSLGSQGDIGIDAGSPPCRDSGGGD